MQVIFGQLEHYTEHEFSYFFHFIWYCQAQPQVNLSLSNSIQLMLSGLIYNHLITNIKCNIVTLPSAITSLLVVNTKLAFLLHPNQTCNGWILAVLGNVLIGCHWTKLVNTRKNWSIQDNTSQCLAILRNTWQYWKIAEWSFEKVWK